MNSRNLPVERKRAADLHRKIHRGAYKISIGTTQSYCKTAETALNAAKRRPAALVRDSVVHFFHRSLQRVVRNVALSDPPTRIALESRKHATLRDCFRHRRGS